MERNNEIISRKDIVKVLAIAISNWYILLGLPIVFFGVSYIYTHRIPDIYAAKCQILLKSNETYDYQQQIYRGLGFNSKYASYEETASQMRVIKSSNLIEDVLERLPLNVSYYIVGRLKVTEVYDHMPIMVRSDERSGAYSGMSFNLNILDAFTFRLQYEVGGISKDKVFRFGELILDDDLFIRIDKQRNLNEVSLETLSQINYMFKVFKRNSLISKYKSSLEVKNLDYTSIVEVTLKDGIPERAAEVLDTLARLYVQNTVRNQTEVNENTLNYIDRQLNEVIRIINSIETELEVYKERKEILNLTREEEAYFERLVDVDQQKRQTELELAAIDELISYLLKNEDVESLLPPSIFVNDQDPQLKAQVEALYELRNTYNSMVVSGTDSNPLIERTLERIVNAKKDILRYLDVRKTALEERLSSLFREINQFERKIKNIPKTQRQIINIERRLAVNEELYSFLLAKRAETIIARAGLVPDTKIIENARSVGVVYPDKSTMNLTNLLIGLAAAILIVVLRSLFFQKINSLGQLQTTTSVSVLGSIPKKKDFSKTFRIRSGSERSDIAQAFRSLRTNLQYFSPDQNSASVMVTSLMPGEGKTFSSVNLASIMAIAGKKVLIIDFDLHKPRLARAMELPNERGVSNILINDTNIAEVIQKTDVPTLDVITSGPIPPNASELILRPELKQIFEYANSHYDYVFLDTPPISLITDGIILMKEVDVKLFVLNSKSTTKTSIDYIERLIESNDFSNCALILNEEKTSRLNYYYSRYGYGGYGYGGYGYGYGGYGGTYGDNQSNVDA